MGKLDEGKIDVKKLKPVSMNFNGKKAKEEISTRKNKRPKSIKGSDVKLRVLLAKFNQDKSKKNWKDLDRILILKKFFNKIFKKLGKLLKKKDTAKTPIDFTCYKDLTSYFENRCGYIDEDNLHFMNLFYKACRRRKIIKYGIKFAIRSLCRENNKNKPKRSTRVKRRSSGKWRSKGKIMKDSDKEDKKIEKKRCWGSKIIKKINLY